MPDDFNALDVRTWSLTCDWDNEPCTTRVMCCSGGCRRLELAKLGARHPGQPDKPIVVLASHGWAKGYCQVDRVPPINIQDPDVIVISREWDMDLLAGRVFDDMPDVVEAPWPDNKVNRGRVDEILTSRVRAK